MNRRGGAGRLLAVLGAGLGEGGLLVRAAWQVRRTGLGSGHEGEQRCTDKLPQSVV